MKLIVVASLARIDLGQGRCERSRALVADQIEEILWNSYTRLAATRSISYEAIAFYPGEEAVMFGLLLALAGVVLMSLFIAYECLCGRL
jgi:hypothetical protein